MLMPWLLPSSGGGRWRESAVYDSRTTGKQRSPPHVIGRAASKRPRAWAVNILYTPRAMRGMTANCSRGLSPCEHRAVCSGVSQRALYIAGSAVRDRVVLRLRQLPPRGRYKGQKYRIFGSGGRQR
jgi:hypothetical protein